MHACVTRGLRRVEAQHASCCKMHAVLMNVMAWLRHCASYVLNDLVHAVYCMLKLTCTYKYVQLVVGLFGWRCVCAALRVKGCRPRFKSCKS